MGAFGEKLRKRREQRGIELDAISKTTKISPRMLRALEDEQFDQLPGGVFNKGFVRAYARQIGLDEEETLSDYLAALRESQVQAQQILPAFRAAGGKHPPVVSPEPPREVRSIDQAHDKGLSDRPAEKTGVASGSNGGYDGQAADRRKGERRKPEQPPLEKSRNEQSEQQVPEPVQDFSAAPSFITLPESVRRSDEAEPSPSWGRNTLMLAFLIVIVGGGVWLAQRHRGEASESASGVNKPAPVAAEPAVQVAHASTVVPPSSVTSPMKPEVTAVAAVPKPTSSKAAPSAVPNSTPPAAAAVAASSAAKPAARPVSGNTQSASPSPRPVVAKAPATFTLLIRAEKTTWISVTSDGKPAAQETLIAPAHTSVRAASEIVVKTGNAAGVSFLLNGKEIPAQGNEGEVKTYVFDSAGLRGLPQ